MKIERNTCTFEYLLPTKIVFLGNLENIAEYFHDVVTWTLTQHVPEQSREAAGLTCPFWL